MAEYVLGVDHGGTKTKAVVADLQGKIHGTATLQKAGDPSYEGVPVTCRAMRLAMERAGAAPEEIVRCTVGFSGADWDFEYDPIRLALSRDTGVRTLEVVNDCMAAMRGGTSRPYGGVVCIGTGLNIGLINREGKRFVYGYLINDEDSGASALGEAAVQAVRSAYTGVGPPTVLSEWILDYFRETYSVPLRSVYDFLVADSTGSPALPRLCYESKELAPLLVRAAEEGDRAAADLLDGFCRRVAGYVAAAARRLSMAGEAFELILSGGVMRGGSFIQRRLAHYAGEQLPHLSVRLAEYEPVCGAVLFSYDRLHCEKSIKESFQKEAAAMGLRLKEREETPWISS